MDNIWDVDDWVEEVARSSYREFCLENVEASVNLPSPEILRRLLRLAEDGKLELWCQAQCPVCSSGVVWPAVCTSTRNYYEFEAPTGSKICGDHEFKVSLDNTFLLFRITAYYMDRVQKQNENHRGIRRFTRR
ncbi:hypothetical protein B7C51_00230 [Paenibacillus larvae subsp. pulvifaciens]|uniref:Uncharacterized protein n=1 Tax=Paenibacillus larvae subsp. pulvifaciens TaxID=1477 RepID=A0A1V0UNM5_9BACL|nr:hypothetical protein [Paenibacillus larvae]ARF66558.1 hypothetical protein B7C51_00230 [Paenibacillus larvae subsp. pulvifaciens]